MKRFLHITVKRTSVQATLKDTLKNLVPKHRIEFQKLKQELQNVQLPNNKVTVGSILGGMRGCQLLYWQPSTLDPVNGIKFHGFTIQECQELLPGPDDSPNIFYPEAMFWLLLTGQIPTKEQVKGLNQQMNKIVTSNSSIKTSYLPEEVNDIINSLPNTMHPMTQLSMGVCALSHFSKFRDRYSRGLNNKLTLWEDTFDDTITLIAFLPSLASKIYRRITNQNNNTEVSKLVPNGDWAQNLTSMMGLLNKEHNQTLKENKDGAKEITNLIRLYTGLHVDHEGGNVSAHATHLVGSALSDPMLSYSAGLLGLAGPLHGLAAQDVVKFLLEIRKQVENAKDEIQVEDYLWSVLNNHRVIPGYGHAVLRRKDPRFSAMNDFIKQRAGQFKDDPNVNLMMLLSKVAPRVLTKWGKCKNPHPNVDSVSGVLFYHYGMKELDFITVIFGCSRSLGPLAQLIWDRIYGLPIERPKSVDFNYLKKFSKL